MKKRQNYSRKREAILNTLRTTSTHPSAEWVYHQLKSTYPDLSLATVYRNLAQFKDDGIITSVGTINGQEHFDGDITPHHHFVCTKCGCILDLPESSYANIDSSLSIKNISLKVERCEVTYYGLCPKCNIE